MDSKETVETFDAVNPMPRGDAAQEGGQPMVTNETVDTVAAVNPTTRGEAALDVRSGQTLQKESVVGEQETVYEFHFNPKCEVTGDTAVEVAERAEEVAAYLAVLAAEPEIKAEPDGNQGMIYRTSNRRVAARFNFPDMWVGGEDMPEDPRYTAEDRRPADSGISFPIDYRVWSCRAEWSVDLAEVLLRLHNHPKPGALLGYRADCTHGAPMLELHTTLTRDEILDAFASTFDTHVMAESLREVPLEQNTGERDGSVDYPETHNRLPRPGRFSLMDRFIGDCTMFGFEHVRLCTPEGKPAFVRAGGVA
jgi:hypothetical protein